MHRTNSGRARVGLLILCVGGCGDIPLPPPVVETCKEGAVCDDGDPCTSKDTCTAGKCKGKPLTCESPPAAACKDDSNIVVYASPGTCSAGECIYPSAVVGCPLGCDTSTGSCKGDPCKGVLCDKPPGPCHRQEGLCLNGTCTYLPEDGRSCDDADDCTVKDVCVAGACAGTAMTCDTPPPNACEDASTAVSYGSQGTCVGGSCQYKQTTTTCQNGCDPVTKACRGDPCLGVVCNTPPTSCHEATGTCTNGSCSYALDNGKACDDKNACTTSDLCVAGSCVGSAIICNTPPKNTCKDASTLSVYTAPGVCSGGQCSYGKAEVSCPFGCDTATGMCKGDPCATMVCESPPSQCFSIPGICSAGKCVYLPKAGATCDDTVACTHTDKCDSAGACVGTTYVCNDNKTCTTDVCNGAGGCSYQLQTGYCQISNVCYAAGPNPANTCQVCDPTKSTSVWQIDTSQCYISGKCYVTGPNPANTCQICNPAASTTTWQRSTGTALTSYGFEGSLEGWTITVNPLRPTTPVKWQLDTKRKAAGSYSLYFGDLTTHTFNDPGFAVNGAATSPSLALPTGQGKLCLEFQLFKITESGTTWDQITLTALPSNAELWKSGNEPNNAVTTNLTFLTFIANLTPYAGQTIQLKYYFNSVDSGGNSGEGAYLDQVRVLANCTP